MATEAKQKAAEAETAFQQADEFSSLLKQSFKPRSERAATEVDNAIGTLVTQALADTSLIKEDVLDTIEEMIARLDEKLSAQMNAITDLNVDLHQAVTRNPFFIPIIEPDVQSLAFDDPDGCRIPIFVVSPICEHTAPDFPLHIKSPRIS